MTVTVTREHRNALHGAIMLQMSGGLGDIEMLLRNDHGGDARDLYSRVGPSLALLDDLGWSRLDERESYVLRMDPGPLAAIIGYHLEQAIGCTEDNRRDLAGGGLGFKYGGAVVTAEQHRAEILATIDEDLEVATACRAVLDQIGGPS